MFYVTRVMKLRSPYNLFLVFIIIVNLAACSAERKNVISKTFHNTTARYNAYFYANQQIKAIEQKIDEANENNYGKVLRIFPQLDSTLATTYQENIAEAIKMAGIAIERHKNSKWVDDSWVLAGRARYYDLDFQNAIETFKYVNKHGKDDDARHEALIWLIRTFIDYEEYGNAVAVSDYLKKEKLNKQNKMLLALTRAYYYQIQNDLNKMVPHLIEGVDLISKKEGKARVLFITGQVYQRLGFESEAYSYYKKCISSNPEYELDFHARLNMAQATQLKDNSDLKSARKVFERLLEDRKNVDFKDKIHYEWGIFEAKQGNIKEALDHFTTSVQLSKNERQKGLAYYQQATIYYDTLNNYRYAQAYYDSAVQNLPRDEDLNFELIDTRNEVLGDFVKYLTIVEKNDSLLTLVQMDTTELYDLLSVRLTEKYEKEKKAREEEEKKARRVNNSRPSTNLDPDDNTVASTWYFDNPGAVAIGQNEFLKMWGQRPLVDNWRISSKVSQNAQQQGASIVQGEIAEGGSAPSEAEEVFDVDKEVRLLLRELPFTQEEQQKALVEIEDALYHLGNIYSLSLNEKVNAAETFESLIARFPGSENEPEVFYQLYLIYKGVGNDRQQIFKDQLLSSYPNTKFSKLVENPNFAEESNAIAEKQKELYRQAYAIYDTGGYELAYNIINNALRETNETFFTSQLELLKIMTIGKLEDKARYQYELAEFIKKYPDSQVTDFAKTLLAAAQEFDKKVQKEKGVSYIPYFDQEHYFILVYPSKNDLAQFRQNLERFNKSFDYLNLKSSTLILDDEYSMILVTSFADREQSLEYLQAFFESNELMAVMPNYNLIKFVISKDNFNLFYQTKGLQDYLAFFEKFY